MAVSPPHAERYLVIFIPSGSPDEETVDALASLAGLSRYDARLSLQSARPRVFRRVDGELAAHLFSEQLTAARIPHYVVSEQSIRSLPVVRARQAELKPRHLETRLDDTRLTIPFDEFLLLVRGEIAREQHNEKKLGSKRGASRSLSPGLLLHLYSQESAVAVEIDPESFLWPDLERELTRSAILNLEFLLDELRARAPRAALDRGFDLEPPVMSRATGEKDLAQVLASGTRVSAAGGVLYSNEEQFRFYARWRYRLERHFLKVGRERPMA